MKRRTILALGAALPMAARAQPAWAPDRPIRLVVPFAPGGSTDLIARLVATAVGERLSQPVVVENRAGAGGNIGAEAVIRAAPDGYTLFISTSGVIAANKALYRNLAFDAAQDLVAISQISFVPNVLVVTPSLPVHSVAELIARARQHPGEMSYGTAGVGTSQHLSGALFAERAGLNLIHVPYRGGAPAVTDLLSGKINFIMSPINEVLEHIRSGQLRALGVTTRQRTALLPQLPIIAETLPGYEIALWNGLMAPNHTPAPVIARLAAEAQAALQQPDLRRKLAEQGAEPVGSSPAEFAAFIRSEVPKWTAIVRASGASAD